MRKFESKNICALEWKILNYMYKFNCIFIDWNCEEVRLFGIVFVLADEVVYMR